MAQSLQLPIPYPLPAVAASTDDASSRNIELLASSIHHASLNWLKKKATPHLLEPSNTPNSTPQLPHPITDGRSLEAMHILVDRWLVLVYTEGHIDLWDLTPTSTDPPSTRIPSYGWGTAGVAPLHRADASTNIGCTSSNVCYDVEDKSIIIVILKSVRNLSESLYSAIDKVSTIYSRVWRFSRQI